MAEKANFKERVGNIQTSLKAPKNLRNTFGNYNYRNAEGILEAVKPYLKENRIVLTLVDDIIAVGDRVFIKAVATLTDMDGEETVSTTALAQIDAHKGMSADQTTGCASSYARKYALNGLFLLDDTKDEDTDEFKKEQMAKGESKASAPNQQGVSREEMLKALDGYYTDPTRKKETIAWAINKFYTEEDKNKLDRDIAEFRFMKQYALEKVYAKLMERINGTESHT